MNMFKGISILSLGNIISQIISFAGIVLLTRLYDPSKFGTFAIVFGIVSILGNLSSFRYEMTILLPKQNNIYQLSIKLAFIISFLMNILYLAIISLLIILKYIEIYWLILPIVVFSNSLINIAKFMQNKNQDYYRIAGVRIAITLLFTICALLFSKINFFENGLIFAMIISYLLPAFYLLFAEFKNSNLFKDLFRIRRLIFWLFKNKKFLFYTTPAVLVSSLTSQVPIFLLSFFSGPSAAGFYSMIQRIIMAPVALISSAINNVYMQKVSSKISNKEKIFPFTKSLIIKIFFPSIILTFLMTITFYFKILEKLFGKEWIGIDILAIAMTPVFLFSFISTAISSFSILKKNEIGLIYQIIVLVAVSLTISISCNLLDEKFLIFLSISSTLSLCFILQIISILKITRGLDYAVLRNSYK